MKPGVFVKLISIFGDPVRFEPTRCAMDPGKTRYRMFLILDRTLPCRLPATALALVYEPIICIITGICLCYSVCG